MKLRIHRFISNTSVEGPGERACIWVQGCPIHCPGCAVPWTWPDSGGELIETGELAQRILNESRVEGVTFVGGEPFEQAAELVDLARMLRSAGLSVVTFTGYVLEHILDSNNKDWADLLAATDLLIAGPYRQELTDLTRPWVGSSNQQYVFLSNRYRYLESTLHEIPNRLEFRLQPNGTVSVNGMGDFKSVRELFDL
jgi:anaerobic ribonucleoside-triphosphate reductase activating protein